MLISNTLQPAAQPLETPQETQHSSTLEYDRIYKEDSIWYGVIEVTDALLTGWNCSYGRCTNNALYIKFSRETEMLTSITYDYQTQEKCIGIKLPLLPCIGSTLPSEFGSETVYRKESDGSFINFLFNNQSIKKLSGDDVWFESTRFDYRIISESNELFKNVNIIEFTYVLTNDEVDAVMLDIQNQYEQELDHILANPHLTLNEKEQAMIALNTEYSEYTIEYGENITSLCLNHDQCFVESTSIKNPFTFQDILSSLKTFFLYAAIILIFFLFGLDAIIDMFELAIKIFIAFCQGIANIVYQYLWLPIYNGLHFLLTTFIKLLFWWV